MSRRSQTDDEKVDVPVEGDTPEAEDVEEEPENSPKGEVVVKYRDHSGVPTERTFSEAVHGKDYKKLAEDFKSKHATRLIK